MVARKLMVAVKGDNGRAAKVDIGLVGAIAEINPTSLSALQQAGFIPVIAPVGIGRDGMTYNINADVAAGALAGALSAEKLILLTDVAGVQNATGDLIHQLDATQARRMISSGAIGAGMIPKVECCLDALRAGAVSTHVIDGRLRHSVLLEVFTDAGVGTEVVERVARTNSALRRTAASRQA